jgi:hypothetical protein
LLEVLPDYAESVQSQVIALRQLGGIQKRLVGVADVENGDLTLPSVRRP